jgi:hypothetical protein
MPRAPEVFAYGTSFQEAWYWNGLPLQSAYGAWNLATMGGSRFGVPVFRGQNYEVPYRAGQNWRAKFPDSRTVTLAFWADGQGQHSSGTYPASDQRLAFNNNLQQLRQAFFQMGAGGSVQGQLQRNWYLTQSGTARLVTSTAMAELAGSMDLTMNGRTSAGFSVDLLLADPFFYGAQVTRACTGASTTVTGLGEGVAGLGYASAVGGFTVSLSAAATVTNTTAGTGFTVASGPSFPVTVDVLNGTVTDNAGVNQIAALSHSGGRAWMAVLPGANTVSVSAGTATLVYNDAYI